MVHDLEANKEVVREFFRRWSATDVDGMRELIDVDGVYWMITSGADLRYGDWTDRVRNTLVRFRDTPRFEVQFLTAEEDRVSVVAQGYSLVEDGTPEGVRYDNIYHWLMEVRDGRIMNAQEFCDPRLADAVFRGGRRMPSEVTS
jgi:ketosteroid isomerase-like protein